MSNLALNGVNVGGTIRELKDGVKIESAIAAAKKDGLDQVFFEANGKNYVAAGEKLDLKGIKTGAVPVSDFRINGNIFDAKIIDVDNEVNSAGEGIKKLSILFCGEGIVGGTLSVRAISKGMAAGGDPGLSKSLGGFAGLVGTALLIGATIGGAAIWGANTNTKPEQLAPYLK